MRNSILFLLVISLFIAFLSCGGESLFDQKFKVKDGFKPSYKVVKIESYPFAGAERKSIKITIPSGLSKGQIKDNMVDCTRVYYVKLNRPDAISITAYKEGTSTSGIYDAAQSDFAPYGEWGKAEKGAPFSLFQFKIDISESYYAKKKVNTLKTGTVITLGGEKDRISVSRLPDSWETKDIIARIPNGTKAEIVDIKVYSDINLTRYQVKLNVGGKIVTGWIHKWDIGELSKKFKGAMGAKEYKIDIKTVKQAGLKVKITIDTNFPEGTLFLVWGFRTYDYDYYGEIFNKKIPVPNNGKIQVIVNIVEKWYKEYYENQRKAGKELFSDIKHISNKIKIIVLYTPANPQPTQVVKILGKNGENVKGKGAEKVGNLVVFRKETSLAMPFKK